MDSSHSKRKVNGSLTAGDEGEDRAAKRRKFPSVSNLSGLYFKRLAGVAMSAIVLLSIGDGRRVPHLRPRFLATPFDTTTLPRQTRLTLH